MTARETGPDRRFGVVGVIVAVGVWVAIVGALAWFLASSHAASRRLLTERTEARVALGAEWATLYVRDVLARERIEGVTWLAGRDVTPLRFARTIRGIGLPTAVLLDDRGHEVQVVPADPALHGEALSRSDAPLAAAVAGRPTVSSVVPSAGYAHPVVAFATPFSTPYGRRVISGAYDVTHTPLGAYLNHLAVTPGHQVYLVDASGTVIASSHAEGGRARTLTQRDPRLAAAAHTATHGSFAARTGAQYFVTANVTGTPWRLLLSVPQAQLFSTADAGEGLEWIVLGGFAMAGLMVIALLARLQRSRSALARVNRELDRLAHTDSLTGVMTRRAITQSLDHAVRAARRHGQDVAVLLIDIDHFKALNDTLGHLSGDLALAHTIHVLAATLGLEDLVGRWGGEEFLVVLPMTDAAGAERMAGRVRRAIEAAPPRIGGADWPLTVTVGVATWSGESMDELVGRADAALYAGKASGRNTVALAPESLVATV